MVLTIYRNNEKTDVEIDGDITIVERLDKALDGANFSFYSSVGYNYPPFTIVELNYQFWFMNTTCNKFVTRDNLYYHNATLVEPTKFLQGLLLGSKGFKVIKGMRGYNDNYHRISTIINLIREKYVTNYYVNGMVFPTRPVANTKVYITADSHLSTMLTQEREYQFGSGTTMYDAISEIMSTEGVLLKCRLLKGDNNLFELRVCGIKLAELNTTKAITNYETLAMSQDVDDYCDSVETELGDVISLDDVQHFEGIVTSNEVIVTEDNALLRMPSRIHKVNSLGFDTSYAVRCSIFRCDRVRGTNYLPVDTRIWHINGTVFELAKITGIKRGYDLQQLADGSYALHQGYSVGNASMHLFVNIPSYAQEDFNRFYEWHKEEWSGRPDFDTCLYYTRNYIYIILIPYKDKSRDIPLYASGSQFVSLDNVLDKNQRNLLDPEIRKFFCAFEYEGREITSLKDETDVSGEFWNRNILNASYEYNNYSKYDLGDEYFVPNFEKGDVIHLDNSICRFRGDMFYPFKEQGSSNLLDHIWKVDYVAISSLMNIEKSTHVDENEKALKHLAKSYSNGSNNVDYKACIDDMKREVNSLGIVQTTLEGYQNFDLGDICTLGDKSIGYVITKQTTIKQSGLIKYGYNFTKDINIIAQAIGIKTQYESTKVVSENVIDRYIYLEVPKSKLPLNGNPFLFIQDDSKGANNYLVKQLDRLEYGDTIYASCSMESNYIFDYTTEHRDAFQGGRTRVPVPITSNQYNYAKALDIYVGKKPTFNKEQYQVLPKYSDSGYVANNSYHIKKLIMKDVSERLIFVVKFK